MTSQSKFLSLALIGLFGIAGIVASFLWHRPAAAVELTTGTFLTPSHELPDFNLIDEHGEVFGTARLRGQWSLLFFGYTNCPDFCPTTLTTLAALKKHLRATKATVIPQVIFVSVDAKRDTPAQLAKYVPYFDPEFIGLTAADQSSIETIAKKLGVSVLIQPTSDGNYTIDHSAEIFVINPSGRLCAILSGPFAVDALQKDLNNIVAASA